MSKYELAWQKLPDWTKAEAYGFMDSAPPEAWAWEFLRRNPAYREDWHQRELLHAAYIYSPPMRDGDDEDTWMRRTAQQTDFHPIKTRKDIAIANKWGLEQLHDPKQPYSPEIRFITPASDFPRFITEPGDLDHFFETVEVDEVDFQRVISRYSIVVFDNARHTTPQLKAVEKELQRVRNHLLELQIIDEAKKPSEKQKAWKKHLRILDARRLSPPTTYQEIARLFSGDADYTVLNRRGKKYVESARAVMNGGYKGILAYKGTPYT